MKSTFNVYVSALAIIIPTTANALVCNGNWRYENNVGCRLVLSYEGRAEDRCQIDILSSSSGTASFDIYPVYDNGNKVPGHGTEKFPLNGTGIYPVYNWTQPVSPPPRVV
jgi:hypothetical protein